MTDKELGAYTDFLNDLERTAEKHGWNIGIADNQYEGGLYLWITTSTM